MPKNPQSATKVDHVAKTTANYGSVGRHLQSRRRGENIKRTAKSQEILLPIIKEMENIDLIGIIILGFAVSVPAFSSSAAAALASLATNLSGLACCAPILLEIFFKPIFASALSFLASVMLSLFASSRSLIAIFLCFFRYA